MEIQYRITTRNRVQGNPHALRPQNNPDLSRQCQRTWSHTVDGHTAWKITWKPLMITGCKNLVFGDCRLSSEACPANDRMCKAWWYVLKCCFFTAVSLSTISKANPSAWFSMMHSHLWRGTQIIIGLSIVDREQWWTQNNVREESVRLDASSFRP